MTRLYGGVRFCDFPCPANIRRLDHLALPLVSRFHSNGIRVDIPFLRSLESRINVQRTDLESQISSSIGPTYQDSFKGKLQPLNLGSDDQVARLLFDHLQVHQNKALQMTKSGKRPSVDDESMRRFIKVHPCINLILQHRELETILNTFVIPLQQRANSDGRVHTHFSATRAATGRLTSSQPNLQQIPARSKIGKEVRKAFIASPGNVLIGNDLSQIEMRWAAHRSQDPTMMQIFRNREDLHNRTACNVFGLDYNDVSRIVNLVENGIANPDQVEWYKNFKQFKRLPCKTVGFGVLYGQTAPGLQASLSTEGVIWDISQCEDFIEHKFFAVYPKLYDMLQQDYRRARRYGMIWDNFGRFRLVPEVRSVHKRIVNEGLRKAGNFPEQSSAQGSIKLAMAELVDIYDFFNKSNVCLPLLQIHDQLINECDPHVAQDVADVTKEVMEHASPLSIPILSSSDQGETWADL